MMRIRLRDMPDQDELAQLYANRYDHRKWSDHIYRVDLMGALAHHSLPQNGTVADLSCGDAAIARRLQLSHRARLVLGDLTPGYEHHGPIEQTIHDIEPVDLFICSETLEHVADPDEVLRLIRPKTKMLLVSTPEGEADNRNPEHVWGWDAAAVEKMLRDAGFTPDIYTLLDLRPAGGMYAFQIWVCR